MSTKIRWTNRTWNPVTGCSHVSPGCEHCYAEQISLRFKRSTKPWKAQFAAENVILHPERIEAPLRWRKPSRVFVNSMSDLFHELIPDWYIFAVWRVMAMTPQHTYQVLTKRPERMRAWMEKLADTGPAGGFIGHDVREGNALDDHAQAVRASGRATMFYDWVESLGEPPPGCAAPTYDWIEGPRWWPTVLPNLWLGVSVEDQRRSNERVPDLLATPAIVRFLSCEPLLGPVTLWPVINPHRSGVPFAPPAAPRLHWVIVGGESGPGHRPMDPDWARMIRDECTAAGVAFFFKQDSGPRTEMRPWLDGMRWEQYPGELTPPTPVEAA